MRHEDALSRSKADAMPRYHLKHGRRRPFFRPWSVVCRCGLDTWPCPVVRMRETQDRMRASIAKPPRNGPTVRLPMRTPLLTRGQQERSRRGRRD